MRFSREPWDILRDTNLVARRCARIASGRHSDIAAMVHVSTRPQAGGQHQNAFAQDSFERSRRPRDRLNLSV